MTTITRRGPDVMHSVVKWTKERTYTVAGVTKTLASRFSELEIVAGYPDELMTITKPTLAVAGPGDMVRDQAFFGGPAEGQVSETDRILLSWFGFVVGRGSDQLNKKYRDELMNDLYLLLVSDAGDVGITLYDAVTKEEIGAVEVENVHARLVPVNAPTIEVDRYKFVVNAEAPYE